MRESSAMRLAAARDAERASRGELGASLEGLVENMTGALAVGVGCGLGLATTAESAGGAIGWTLAGVAMGVGGAAATLALGGRLEL